MSTWTPLRRSVQIEELQPNGFNHLGDNAQVTRGKGKEIKVLVLEGGDAPTFAVQ